MAAPSVVTHQVRRNACGAAAMAAPTSRTSAAWRRRGWSGGGKRRALQAPASRRFRLAIAGIVQRERLETGVAVALAEVGAELAAREAQPVRDPRLFGEEHLSREPREARFQPELGRQAREIEPELRGAAAGEHLREQELLARHRLPRDVARGISGLIGAERGEVVAAGAGVRRIAPVGNVQRWRQAGVVRPRVDERLHVRLDVAPGAEETDGVARLDRHARELQPPAMDGRQRERRRGAAARRHVERVARGREARRDRDAVELARVIDVQMKAYEAAGERRLDPAGADREMREVAIGVEDRRHAHSREQKSEDVAERELVVDRADQHQQEREPEEHAVARRQDVHAALREEDRPALRSGASREEPPELVDLGPLQPALEAQGRPPRRDQGIGTASTSPTAMSELVRRTPFTTGCRRWVATPGSTAWTSSGST